MLAGDATGVVDQNIDPAESRVRPLATARRLRVIGLRSPIATWAWPPRFPDLFRDLVGPVAIAPVNHDQAPSAAHHLGDCRADS